MLVPTVNGTVVLLPGHTDEELKVDEFHYHVDRRFHGVDSLVVVRGGEVIWLDKESSRPEPCYDTGIDTDFLWLYLLRSGAVVGDGVVRSVCPHKGALLAEGCQRCPFHGLPNPIPNAADVTVTVRDSDSRVLGSVRLDEASFPTIQIPVTSEGVMNRIEAHGLKIKSMVGRVLVGDLIKLTMNVNGVSGGHET